MTWPSLDVLRQETARLARFFHWSLDSILDLPHHERRAFLREARALGDSA